MSARDPGDTMIQALRRANPVPAEQAAGRRSLPSAHALFADIVAQPQRRVGGRMRRRALFVVIAIIVLALLLAGFVAVHRSRARLPLTTECYAAPSLEARRVVVASGDSPARACEKYWSDGTFARRTIPLDVCVLPSGVPAVFPGESGSVCNQLGLAVARPLVGAVAKFSDEAARMVAGTCIDDDAAESIVRRELAKFGLTDWTIVRDPNPPDAVISCASLYIDISQRRVSLVPLLNPYTPASTGG